MPTPPELGNRHRKIGCVEVLHEPESHDLCTAKGDVGIARKVVVDLKSEEQGAQGQGQTACFRGGIEQPVDHGRKTVGYDYLFEHAHGHELQAVGYPIVVEHVPLAELMQKVLRAFDWSGDQLRIEHDIQGEDSDCAARPSGAH